MKHHLLPVFAALLTATPSSLSEAQDPDWEATLKASLSSERSASRHDGLKQIDTKTRKGLQTLWKVLSNSDPLRLDWYVRQGAYEALLQAEGEEADEQIEKLLDGSGKDLAKEALLQSIVWKIRRNVVEERGGGRLEREAEKVKYHLRKSRGVDYFEFVLPTIRRFDPDKKYLGWIHKGLADKSSRVRRAAMHAAIAYPDRDSIPILLENLKSIERRKKSLYDEWVVNRFALEQLSGMYFRESVEDWFRWWDTVKDTFSIDKRIEEEKGAEEEGGRTTVVRTGGVEITVQMKIAGEGYPLVVLPWRGYEVDYLRPYFHGIEEFAKVFYVRMPMLGDYKGLARDTTSNIPKYPTQLLSTAFKDIVQGAELERYAVLAHGSEACHLAMLLVQSYGDSISHLVLINPWSDGGGFGRMVDQMRRRGLQEKFPELVKGADARIIEGEEPRYKATDDDEAAGIGRATFNQYFADPTRPEIGALEYLYRIPGGTGVLIDNTWDARKIMETASSIPPSYIFFGERSGWTAEAEVSKVATVFPKSKIVPFKSSGDFPFMEETYAFTGYVRQLLRDAIKEYEAKQSGDK